jgi:hypothetical protein
MNLIVDELGHTGTTVTAKVHLSGDLSQPGESLQVFVHRITQLRDEFAYSVGPAIPLENGQEFGFEIPNLKPGYYAITDAFCQSIADRFQRESITLLGPTLFEVPFRADQDHLSLVIQELRESRENFITAELVTEQALSRGGNVYTMTIFYVGANVGTVQHMRGMSMAPLSLGSGAEGVVGPALVHLRECFGTDFLPQQSILDQYRQDNPMFAVHFHNIRALDQADAISLARSEAHDIATMVAVERGARPEPVLAYLANASGYVLFPVNDHVRRRNFIGPLFSDAHARMVEEYQPKLRRSPKARLVVELYVQALAENDHGFKLFRYWSLLETIAIRHVPRGVPVYELTGAPIMKGSVQRTTDEKSARVYEYLRSVSLPAQSLATLWSDGRSVHVEGQAPMMSDATTKVISLWEMVDAFYQIRNAVGHEGEFDAIETGRDPAKAISSYLYAAGRDVLEDAARTSVFTELNLA